MINIFKTDHAVISQVDDFEDGVWVQMIIWYRNQRFGNGIR